MKTKLKAFGLYLLKHWRWTLLGICIILVAVLPGTFWNCLKGMAVLGFIWISWSIVNFYGNTPKK